MATVFETCFRMDVVHDIKVLFTHGVFWSAISYITRPYEYSLTNEIKKKLVSQYRMTITERLIFLSLVTCTILNIYIRFSKGVPHWLCQPCHILSFYLIYVMLFAGKDPRFFYSYFYSIWMPMVGFVSPPNESWFEWWWEKHVFYIHHFILLAIPFYYLMVNHRFHDYLNSGGERPKDQMVVTIPHFTSKLERFKIFTHTFSHGIIYHACFLGILGLLLDEDFDAMRCRFDGGEMFGIYWREALICMTYIASLLIAWIPDYLVHLYYKSKFTKLPIKKDMKKVD